MKRHDTIDLWSYAAHGLSVEDARYADLHLSDCPECQSALARVQAAQDVLITARLSVPQLKLARADAAIAAEVSKRLLKRARPVRWALWLAPAAVALAAVVALVVTQWPLALPMAHPAAVAAQLPEVIEPNASVVERAVDLKRSASGQGVASGGRVASGESLSTGARGVGILKLPDTSRLRLAASTRLSLSITTRESVFLQLERGRVAVHAAHVPREGFTLKTADVTINVLGTTFAVSRGGDWVEVAVVEGRVGVESRRGLPFFVSAGERVRVGTHSWRPVSRTIGAALRDELREVAPSAPLEPVAGSRRPSVQPGPAAAQPDPLVVPLVVTPLDAPGEADPGEWEMRLSSRAPVGLRGVAEPNLPGERASAGPGQDVAVPAAGGQPSPVPVSAPAAAPSSAAVPAAAPAPAAAVPVAAPRDPAPQAPAPPPSAIAPAPAPAVVPAPGPGPAAATVPAPAVATVPAPAAATVPAPAAATVPAPAAATVPAPAAAPAAPAPIAAAPALVVPEARGPMPEDLEELFLMRAERSLRAGGCERYLLGLADIAEDPQRTMRQERARIAMARCQSNHKQDAAAAQEFARYVRDFPQGLFIREAAAGAAWQPAVPK